MGSGILLRIRVKFIRIINGLIAITSLSIPEEFYNGYDLYDILEACGYFDEDPSLNVILELSHAEARVGGRRSSDIDSDSASRWH